MPSNMNRFFPFVKNYHHHNRVLTFVMVHPIKTNVHLLYLSDMWYVD